MMTELISIDILEQSAGASVNNHRGESLGYITEVTFDNKTGQPEYIIVRSDKFYGNEDRFFAIPACSTLVTTDEKKNILLKVTKNDLRLARRIRAEQCPRPDMQFAQPVYELYRYKEPDNRNVK